MLDLRQAVLRRDPWREVQLNPRSATRAQDLQQSHTPLPPFPRSVIMSYAAEIPSNFFPCPSLVSHFWYVGHCFAWQYKSQNHLMCTFLRKSDGVQLNIQNNPSPPTNTNHSLSVISCPTHPVSRRRLSSSTTSDKTRPRRRQGDHKFVTFVACRFPLEEAPEHFSRLRRGLMFSELKPLSLFKLSPELYDSPNPVTWEAVKQEGPYIVLPSLSTAL